MKDDALVPGVVDGDEIRDLTVVAPDLPREMPALLATGASGLAWIRSALAGSRGGARPLSEVELGPPIERPSKFFAIGLNYADHVAESSFEPPEWPTVFTKLPTSVIGPRAAVERPSVSDQLDYEGELAFVISRRCRHVPRDRAHEVIGGYMIANDFSVRDWQRKSTQWTLGKGFDTHGATGPWIVTPDEIDPHSLGLKTHVNGELRQSSNTRNLIHDCFSLVELLSTVCTLEPGDIVATGTPGGVGSAMDPPRFLVPGDVVRVEIDGLGVLENTIIAETSKATVIADEDALEGLAA
jgi:2-keto-4-pentenoate hydratase/2-oxohepta-3-ene-1,7-dioic acid hydratase in catechol pathway